MTDPSNKVSETSAETGQGNKIIYNGPPLRNLRVLLSPLQIKNLGSTVKLSPQISKSLSDPPTTSTSSNQGKTIVLTKKDGTLQYLRVMSPAASGNVVKMQTTPVINPTIIANPSPGRLQAQTTQKTPCEDTEKCAKFLKTLVDLSKLELDATQKVLIFLIQSLVNSKLPPLDFCNRLEELTRANPQPEIAKFLIKSLPKLQKSMLIKETVIEGIRAPYCIPVQVKNQPNVPSRVPPPLTISRVKTPQTAPKKTPKISTVTPRSAAQLCSTSSFNLIAPEDDINDVVTMGGIDLVAETEHVYGSTYSLKRKLGGDKPKVNVEAIKRRIEEKLAKYGLGSASRDVSALIGHATDEYLKDITENLSNISEHRTETLKMNKNYETSSDVRVQIKFLEEIEKAKEEKNEQHYRELMMEAAKSRSKTDYPEIETIKAKVKEMQRVELEELRKQEANNTALMALGMKKPAMSAPPILETTRLPPKVKRVNISDLIFHMEQDKNLSKSNLLYKLHLK